MHPKVWRFLRLKSLLACYDDQRLVKVGLNFGLKQAIEISQT